MRRASIRIGFIATAAVFAVGCGGDSATSGVAGATLTVHAKDNNRFDKPAYTAQAGNVTIGYENDGQLVHTLLIEGKPELKLTVARNQPSTSGAITLAPGTYTMYCDVPGHRADGMVAQLVVQ